MTPQELKNSILQLAIQGKLVEQRPEEGTVEELYQQIKAKLPNLMNQNEIKDEEKPFEVPESWFWIRLGTAFIIERGGSPRPIKAYLTDSDDGINWIKIGDTEKGGKYINSTKEKIIPEGMKKSRFVRKGDFLLSNSMSFGRPYILNIDGCIHDGWLVLHPIEELFDKDYLYYLLSSPMVYYQFCKRVAGAVVNNLNTDKVALTIVPVPPLVEQKRIVDKIEELLPYVDRYEKAWSKLEELNKCFPTDLQKSILQLAIQGKLVEQRPEEGTAEELYQQIQAEKQRLIKEGKIKKEKPLPEISEDEIPFDIPESWKWVRVIDIAYLSSGNQYSECSDGTLYIKVADMSLPENEYEICTSTRKANVNGAGIIPTGSIIFPKRGGAIATNKKRLVLREPICVDSNIMAMTVIYEDILPYLCKWFSSIDLGKLATGTSVPQINNRDIYPLLVPLPPLAEQKRIVKKLEEILPLCEKISKID